MNEAPTGSNRSGLKASPMDAGELLELLEPDRPMAAILAAASAPPTITADAIRASYQVEAENVGSMPPPATIKGAFGSVVQALSGNHLQVLLDKLGERAAYERSGTRLYDAALRKFADLPLPAGMTYAALQEIRDEEAGHFLLLVEAIESLGGDATTQTPCADVSAVQSMGLMQTINDPRTTPAQALQTLLAAELIDNASWELLIELSAGFGMDELAARFRTALEAETRHLANVRDWLAAAVNEAATGSPNR
jgi:ferritin-like protein